jgi:hypothetical protein
LRFGVVASVIVCGKLGTMACPVAPTAPVWSGIPGTLKPGQKPNCQRGGSEVVDIAWPPSDFVIQRKCGPQKGVERCFASDVATRARGEANALRKRPVHHAGDKHLLTALHGMVAGDPNLFSGRKLLALERAESRSPALS